MPLPIIATALGFFISKIGCYVLIVGGVLLAIVTFGASQRRKGAQKERQKAKEADHERAEEIRDSVSRARNDPDSLRKYEDAGYRD